MRAIVIGATGATGKDLVELLLKDNCFEQIDIFVRKPVVLQNDKLHVHIVDFEKMDEWKDLIQGDVLFSTLGTTLKQAGSQKNQWKIDYDYQFDAAHAARNNGVNTYVLVSSFNANSHSSFFYPRMKGQLDEAVIGLAFPKTFIVRPPSLIRKGSDRFGEKISIKILNALNSIGLLKSWAPISTEIVAQAMISTAKDTIKGTRILSPEDIRNAAK